MNKFKTILLAAFVALSIAFAPVLIAGGEGEMALINGTKPISMAKAEALLSQKNAYAIDVNTEETHEEYGFLPNAIFANTAEYAKLLPANKNAVLIVYGLNRLGYTASEAALAFSDLGYKNVYVMIDGLEGWILSGRPAKLSEVGIVGKKPTEFIDNIHEHMIFGKIPSCRDCHGANSSVSKKFVNDSCVKCHETEGTAFKNSIHSKTHKRDMFSKNTNQKPSCTDCHSVHSVKFQNPVDYKKASDAKCGECHKKQQAHYYETFHGKAMYLQRPGKAPKIAACFDCHGAHNILKPSNEKSTLGALHRNETCKQCHINSNDEFAFGFIAHADHSDGDKYPELNIAYKFMTGLLIAVFGFFGVHTLLWSIKLISLRLKYPKEFKAAKKRAHNGKVRIRRFSTLHIVLHFFVAASFLGLAFSGLPQKFYTTSWASTLISLMGGIEIATLIHRVSAFIMCACFVVHIAEIIYRYKKSKFSLFGADSLMPRVQDFRDLWANLKWFVGVGERPQFDRWTYWEKFDYLAVFWGMFIIGFSGFVLWFPTFFASFLPPWAINLSTIVHSDEALLATGFIFAVHFFNTHFRADRFPMDTVIFSGHLSEEELKAERANWYERLKSSGKLDKLIVKNDNFDRYEIVAKLIGFAMLLTGLVFLVQIGRAHV